MSANVDMVHFCIGSQKPFVGSSPSRLLDKVAEDHLGALWDALRRILNFT